MRSFLLLLLCLLLLQVTSTTSSCSCEKGERGEKGDAGICPVDCASRPVTWQKECLGPRINLQRLAQSIRQLILETKTLVHRTSQETSCTCPSTVNPSSTNLWRKGDKGDPGLSCQNSNIRIFQSLQQAIDASSSYPDHTYIHLVDQSGYLQGVFIRVHGSFFPLTLQGEISLSPPAPAAPPPTTTTTVGTTYSTKKCSVTLPCPRLHLFALGPFVRKMCQFGPCGKLSDYDRLCARVAEQHRLTGFYRALMSASNQWLVNLFADVCVSAKIVNIHDQLLFDRFDAIFEQKAPANEILDIQGLKPKFQYWWHGTLTNGSAAADTCFDWTRHDSRLSGVASRVASKDQSLFTPQYRWPCSIGDSNMGIFCIETNCDKRVYYNL